MRGEVSSRCQCCLQQICKDSIVPNLASVKLVTGFAGLGRSQRRVVPDVARIYKHIQWHTALQDRSGGP